MKIFLFLLVAFFVIKLEADAIEIVCDYRINHNHHRNHPYACIVQSVKLLSIDDCELTSVTGEHKPGKSNDDVTFLFSYEKTFNCFPKIITKFFKNIDAVAPMVTNIATIDKSDLKQFGEKLKYLNLYGNKIEVIDSDLFEYTPNIEVFYPHHNQIKYVGSGVFSNLQNLTYLQHSSNPCNSGGAYDRASVIKLIPIIEGNCTDFDALERHRKLYPTTTTTTEAPTTTTTARNYDEELRIEIAKLNEEAAKSKAENDNLKAEIAKLLLEVEAKNQNKDIIKKLIELEAKIEAKMEAKFDLLLENFTSINGTCSAFDYKLDLVNRDCISRTCHRQP